MKKFFITTIALFSLLLSVGTAQGQFTQDNCKASFYSDAALTTTVSSMPVVGYYSVLSGSSDYCAGPEYVYAAFPLPSSVTSLQFSTVNMFVQPKGSIIANWWNLKDWGDAEVNIQKIGNKQYMVAKIHITDDTCQSTFLRDIAKERINLKATINGQQCETENILPKRDVSQSCDFSYSVCYDSQTSKYKAGFKVAHRFFRKDWAYRFYPYPGFMNSTVVSVSSADGVVSVNEKISDYFSFDPGTHTVSLGYALGAADLEVYNICSKDIVIGPEHTGNNPDCSEGIPEPEDPVGSGIMVPFDLCKQTISYDNQRDGDSAFIDCTKCFENGGIWTAIGCIPIGSSINTEGEVTYDISATIRAIIWLGLGIGGGVVVLMILAAGFILSTSQGDPKRVEEGKEMVTSAVMGLMFVIFSITILRFIGVSVLQIPGFGG